MLSSFLGLALLLRAGAFSLDAFELPSHRTHFAKHAGAGVFSGGRLTSRQILYLGLDGFGTLVAMGDYTPLEDWNGVVAHFPGGAEEATLGAQAGMRVNIIKNGGLDMKTLSTLTSTITDAIAANASAPVYVHCHAGKYSNLMSLLSLVQLDLLAKDQVYVRGLELGWDFATDQSFNAFIATVTGLPLVPVQSPSIESELAEGEASYLYFYWAMYTSMSEQWYNAGQILSIQLGAMQTAGYKAVINFRVDNETINRLGNETAAVFVDNAEFSDAAGLYSEPLEAAAVTKAGLAYFHIPVGASDWTKEALDAASPVLDQVAAAYSPTLVHCATGFRSSAYLLAYEGRKQGKNVQWALDHALGFGYDFSGSQKVVDFFEATLG